MTLTPAVELAPHCSIRTAAGSRKGRLIATEKGVGCEWTDTQKVSLLKKQTTVHRDWFVLWSQVVSYTINGQEKSGGAAGVLNHSYQDAVTTLTLKTAEGMPSWHLKSGPASVYSRLGPWLAGIDARQTA